MLFQYYPPPKPHDYIFELNKDFNFSAAHRIANELAGKCENLHGHTYVVNITIGGNELDECGFLIDFKKIKNLIHDRYDHTLLNDHFEYNSFDSHPSTENVAEQIYRIVQTYLNTLSNKPVCLQVMVRETPTSYVLYRP